jgi:hypothetical protein
MCLLVLDWHILVDPQSTCEQQAVHLRLSPAELAARTPPMLVLLHDLQNRLTLYDWSWLAKKMYRLFRMS